MTDKKTGALPADIADMTFEAALAALEQIVRGLESGTGDLQTSIDAYARGVALKQHCAARLREAQMRIEKISLDAEGAAAASPLDIG